MNDNENLPNRRAHTPRRKRSIVGATFIEVSLATVIIATAVVGAMSSMTETAKVYHYFADGPHEALMLAQEIHEGALLLPFEPVLGENDLFGTNVETVYDLDGRTYSPPRSAQYETIHSHKHWSQAVNVRLVAVDDPSVEVENPEAYGGPTLTELTVTVFDELNQEAGAFTWWMAPPEHED